MTKRNYQSQQCSTIIEASKERANIQLFWHWIVPDSDDLQEICAKSTGNCVYMTKATVIVTVNVRVP